MSNLVIKFPMAFGTTTVLAHRFVKELIVDCFYTILNRKENSSMISNPS